MSESRKPPFAGIDFAAARKLLEGVVLRALDVDWLAVDAAGHVAVLLGEDGAPLPPHTNAERTALALEAVTRGLARRLATPQPGAYRVAALRAQEPIFDLPRRTRDRPLHERPFDGYPHLVVVDSERGPTLRRFMTELGGREVLARDGFAAALDVVGFISYEELHTGETPLCAGCRVLDVPSDPRPRSPEALATAGLYVYGFGEDKAWLRIASPSIAADREDLQEMAHLTASFERLDVRFEDSPWIEL